MRSVTSLLVALQLGFAGACKKEEAPSPAATAPSSSPTPATPEAAAPVIEPPPPPAAPSYPSKLDDLLALVPADATAYAVIRDPKALFDGVLWLLDAERDAITSVLDGSERSPVPPQGTATIRSFIRDFGGAAQAFASATHLERGHVIYAVGAGAPPVHVFAADHPNALRDALAASGIESAQTCLAVPIHAGFVACSSDVAALDTYALPDAAAKHREHLATTLVGRDIERANVLGFVTYGDARIAAAFEATAGTLQVDVQFTGVPDDARQFLRPATPGALEVVAPGTTFVWVNAAKESLVARADTMPAPVANVLKSYTGETLIAASTDPFAMLVLMGVTDPMPARGAMALAMVTLGQGKKPLPGGGTVDVQLENVTANGAAVQAIHAKVEDRPELADFSAYGIKGEAFAFAAGKWLAVALGSDAAIVDHVAKLSGAGPSKELLASLPPELARALQLGETSIALHLAFDGLQSPALRRSTKEALAALPTGTDPLASAMLNRLHDLLAPLSSISAWLTWNDLGPQVHLAVQAFADPTTDAGKAAQATLIDVARGGDPKAAYEGLAARFADAPRAVSYRMRAGLVPGADAASLGAVALSGMLAAIAIPAFVKYQERARENK